MGRAKKLKELRKAVKNLPPDYEQNMIVQKVEGYVLIKERNMFKLPNGEEVDPDKVYLEKTPVINKVDHYQKLKKYVRPGKSNHQAGQDYVDNVLYKDMLRKKQKEEQQKAVVNE